MSFKKNFYKNAAVIGGFNVASTAANLLSSAVLARFLTPNEFGFVAMINVFVQFINQFTDAGISFTIVRTDYNRTYFRALSNISFYIGVVLFFLMVLLSYPISLFFGNEDLVIPTIVYSTVFIAKSLSIIPSSILIKELDFNYVGFIKFLGNVFCIVLMITMAVLGASIWSLIIPQVLMLFFNYFLYDRKVKLGFGFYPWANIIVAYRKSKSIIWNMSGLNVINYWSRNADRLIIGKIFGEYALGIYTKATRMLVLTLNQTQQIFGNVLLPSLKTLNGKSKQVREEYLDILGVMSLVNYPIAAVFVMIPRLFTKVFWGETWMEVAEFLPYMGVLILIQTINSTTGHVYILMHKEKVMFRVGLASSSIIILLFSLGSIFSTDHMLFFYSTGFILFILPLNLIFGFHRSFKFSVKEVLKFWLPKMIMAVIMLASNFYDIQREWNVENWYLTDTFRLTLSQITFIVYGIYVYIDQQKNVKKLGCILRQKLRKK